MKPLAGIRVLEVTGFLAGPYCGLLLAHLGAEVIRIEPIEGDRNRDYAPFLGPDGINLEARSADDFSLIYLARARGRKGITLNLKSERGQAIFRQLAARVDVVLENLSPGSLARLGLGYPDIQAVNDRLIYCSISGFGQTGPYRDRPAFDPVIQAMSGVMSLIGEPDGPPMRTGAFYLADQATPLFALISILSALRQRDQTGRGQFLDVSMMDCLVSLLWMEPLGLYEGLDIALRTGNSGARHGPMNVYPTTDGWILIVAASNHGWAQLARAVGRPDLVDDPRYQTNLQRAAGQADLDVVIGGWTRQHATEDALEHLRRHDVACGPVNFPADVQADEHVRFREILSPVQHPLRPDVSGGAQPRFPVLFSDAETGTDPPVAPALGADNGAIYRDWLGYSAADLEELRAAGII